jgi:hypothetical protein
MKGPEILKQNVDVVKSRMGACFLGERVLFRGQDLLKDLINMNWVEFHVFGITGRKFTPQQLRLMNALLICTSYPDARIWNNRVAALAGTTRSTGNLAVSAALAVSEASIYGRGIDIRAIDFLLCTRKEIDSGGTLDECIRKELEIFRGIAGYGRPIMAKDERIAPLLKLANTLGLDNGPHVRLAHEIEDCLLKGRWRLRMNAAALWAAFGADLGFSPREYYLFLFPVFLAGMYPCFIESSLNPEGALLPLACSHLKYEGQPKRKWRLPDQS